MKKTFSVKELKDRAQKVLEQYPLVKQVFATADGNVFLMRNRAELHSKGKIYTFDRAKESSADTSSNEPQVLTKAKDIIQFISTAKNLEAIKPYAEDKRTTVKEAFEAKAKELVNELEVNQ